jgi:N-acetylglucosaminyl-diphospho-decaprenol L-rhamnosyltransferase
MDILRAALPAILPGGQSVTVHAAPGNIGYAAGVNSCLVARPDADAWWILNPDTRPEPDALSPLIARHALGDADALASVLAMPDGTVQAWAGLWRPAFARTVSLGNGERDPFAAQIRDAEAQMNFIHGAAMFITRRFLDTVGLMREDYFLYAEEIEWFLRAKQRGMRLGVVAESRVIHHQGATTGSAKSISERPRLPVYMDERNKLNVVRDTTPMLLPIAAVMSLALLTLRYGAKGGITPWRNAVSGWWAGVRNRRGKPPWMAAD